MACGLGSEVGGGLEDKGQGCGRGLTRGEGAARRRWDGTRVTRRPCHVRFQPRPFSSTGPPRASTSPGDVVDHLEFRQRPYVRYRSARNHATTLCSTRLPASAGSHRHRVWTLAFIFFTRHEGYFFFFFYPRNVNNGICASVKR